MAGLNINKMLRVSMETQTNGIYGAGTPLGFVSDPGLGKTAIVRSFCESINHHCEVIILGRVPSIDIGGMYAPNFETKELIHLISKRLLGEINGTEDRDGVCIFFDEVAASSEEQQAAIQSIIQDRMLEGNKVPDNVWFAFAWNPSGSNCGSNEIIRSLLDRIIVVPIVSSGSLSGDHREGPCISVQEDLFPQWMELAIEDWNLHPWVPGYNHYMKGEAFHSFDPGALDPSQPSPRSWEKLSHILHTGIDGAELQLMGSGCIGAAQWAEFWGWVQLGKKVATYEEIIEEPLESPCPPDNKPDHQMAVMMNIARGVSDSGSSIERKEVDAVLSYFRRLPETFAAYGWKICNKNNPDFSSRSPEIAIFTQDYSESIR